MNCSEVGLDDKSRLSLLISLKRITQRILSYPGLSLHRRNGGTELFLCKVDEIFQHALNFDFDEKRECAYSGILQCVAWCTSKFKSDPATKAMFEECGNDEQCSTSKGKNAPDFVQKILLIGALFDCLVFLLQDSNILKKYGCRAFLNDATCVVSLLTCLKALHKRCSLELAGFPLDAIKHDCRIVLSNNSKYHRVHSVSGNSKSNQSKLDMFDAAKLQKNSLAETMTMKESSQDKSLKTGFDSPKTSFLPDVVACHTEKLETPRFHEAAKHGVTSEDQDRRFDLAQSTQVSFSDYTESIPNAIDLQEKILHSKNTTMHDYSDENAHLNLSELLITVIQGRKCGLSKPDLLDSSIDNRVPQTMKSYPSAEGGSLHDIAFSIEDSLYKLDSEVDDNDDIYRNAGESTDDEIGDSILGDFEDARAADNGKWFVSEKDVPQSLLPLPRTLSAETLVENESLSGSCTSLVEHLGQPELQLILQTHKDIGKSRSLALQKYKCSGCGSHAERSNAKRFRFCEFMGEYFCPECHDNSSTSVIPAYIFQNFNFKKYKVSKVAVIMLDEIHAEPLFHVKEINSALYSKNSSLRRCYELRERGANLLKRLEACPDIWDQPDEPLHSILNEFPPHILKSDSDLYSIQDLINVKTRKLEKLLSAFVDACQSHFKPCCSCSTGSGAAMT